MPKDVSTEETSLADQRAVARAQEEKEGLQPLGEGASHSGELQRCREAVQGEN